MKNSLTAFLALLALALLPGCQTTDSGLPDNLQAARVGMARDIAAEPPGDYFIGRRYYKVDYKFWGYVRKPGQPWSTAKLVMFNENQKLAPDRELGTLGSDNSYEYKLTGYFSGDTVYEPASNGMYPEFVLTGYELKSVSPTPIFKVPGATDPVRRIIAQPY